ncbi:hypothetical protein TNCV_504071 [Trichonephila clavipes]|nr:hypothetical protein TNCV_504071 [Trichonephila clavipes]
MESKLEAKIFEKVEDVSISFRSDLEKLKQKVMTGQGMNLSFELLIPSLPSSFLHMTESPLGSGWISTLSLMLWSYASREMCEGLQQTPAEVTAAESVQNAPRTGDGRREAFSLGVF